MLNYHVSISPEADADLDAIYDYIASDSPQNAARMVARILNSIAILETFPHRTVVERHVPAEPNRVRFAREPLYRLLLDHRRSATRAYFDNPPRGAPAADKFREL